MSYHNKLEFATAIHFQPSLIFLGEAMSLPLQWRLVRGLTCLWILDQGGSVCQFQKLSDYDTATITAVISLILQAQKNPEQTWANTGSAIYNGR